jgi:hypothetical protein
MMNEIAMGRPWERERLTAFENLETLSFDCDGRPQKTSSLGEQDSCDLTFVFIDVIRGQRNSSFVVLLLKKSV